MPSELQLTLCVPEVSQKSTKDISTLREFMESVSAFFQKFPLRYEVLLAVAKPSDELRAIVSDPKHATQEQNLFRIVEAGMGSTRSKKLKALFSESKGDVVVATSVNLETPLGDIFKMLQELYTDPELQAVFGHRGAKNSLASLQARDPLEVFFQNIAFEKVRWPFKDLFCPTFALRKSAFEKVQPALTAGGWHWTMEVQRAVVREQLKALEVPVTENVSLNSSPNSAPAIEQSSGSPAKPSSEPVKRVHGLRRAFEALRLLSFVVFRI